MKIINGLYIQLQTILIIINNNNNAKIYIAPKHSSKDKYLGET